MNKILILTISLLLSSCDFSNYNKLERHVSKQTKGMDLNGINWVAFVDDAGCIGCVSTFSQYMEKHIGNDLGLILLSASGTKFDISAYYSESGTNVYDADYKNFIELELLKTSGIIFLKDDRIDTTLIINANDLQSQLNYIDTRTK